MATKSVRRRTRIAHHEAAHAVLSAALNDAPHLVSIVENATSRGRARYRREAPPERLVQVDLAGFAAEELLCGCRPRQLHGAELGFSIMGVLDERARGVLAQVEGCDQYLAVNELVAMGCAKTADAIRCEFDRFYGISKESVHAVWPAVQKVAKALMKVDEIDSDTFFAAVRGEDIYGPVFAVQRAHGLLSARPLQATSPDR